MRNLLALLFLLYLSGLYAQKNALITKYLSLKINSSKENVQIDSLYSFFKNNLRTDDFTLDSLSKDFNDYAQAQNNKNMIGAASLASAMICKEKENNVEGITYALRSINVLDSATQLPKICYAYQLLAHFYTRTSNFAMSGTTALKALEIAETLQDNRLLFNSYNFIGISYIREKKFNEAIELYRKAINIAVKSKDKSQFSKVYTNLGIAYRNRQNWDSALFYHEKSLKYAKERNDRHDIAFALNDIGVIYLRIDDYPKALNYLLQSAEMREQDGEKWELGFTYNFIAEGYMYLEKFKESEKYARKAITNSYISKNVRQRYESYEYLSVINQYLQRYDSAFYYLQKNTALKDSFQRVRTNFMTDALIASYQFKEKEKEIKLLNETSENQKLQIQKQQLYLFFTIIGLALFIVIVVLFIRTRKQTAGKILLEAKLKEESLKLEAAESLQKEKERISRDLHDNVGGHLSYVLYSIDDMTSDDKDKREQISKNIDDSVRTVISNLRETIWAINKEEIDIHDLFDKLKVYARSMFKNTLVKLTFSEKIEQEIALNSLLSLNLYRISQEIINNAFKHSKANELTIFVSSQTGIKIIITDNGVGFNDSDSTSGSYGLSNIKSRAHESGIKVEITSEPNKGTTYILIV